MTNNKFARLRPSEADEWTLILWLSNIHKQGQDIMAALDQVNAEVTAIATDLNTLKAGVAGLQTQISTLTTNLAAAVAAETVSPDDINTLLTSLQALDATAQAILPATPAAPVPPAPAAA